MTTAARTLPLAAPNAVLGVGLMLAAMFMFSANDVLGKWLVSTYSVGQVLLIRSAAGLIILAPFILRAGWRTLFSLERPWLQAARATLATAEVYLFYLAVRHMPLADAMTFWLAAPIYVAALSPWLLGEKVGWRRWTAIGVGFVGVVIALDPSAQMLGGGAIYAIAGSLCFGLMMVTGRILRGTPDVALVFWQMLGALAAGAVTAGMGWVAPTGFDVALLALLGVVAMAAHILVNRALKLADAATIAPLQYTLLLWAIVFGYVIFGDIPRADMLLGAAVITAAGLYIFFRERKVQGAGDTP
ncbi:MAG: DMT family transporter [Rubrimonas sp.]